MKTHDIKEKMDLQIKGDRNNRFFHASVKHQRHYNRINALIFWMMKETGTEILMTFNKLLTTFS